MSSHSTSSTLQAIYHVFVRPALSAGRPSSRLPLPRPTNPAPTIELHRQFSATGLRLVKTRAPEKRSQKWDEEITARTIALVDPITNQLSAPRTRFDVLNAIDRQTHRLVQLSPDEPENWRFVPVCKIVSKKETYEAEKRRKERTREANRTRKVQSGEGMKTLELNWAIDANDLEHRLDRVRAFLAEGRRVEIVLAAKKRGRKASIEECHAVLSRIAAVVDGVEGAKEVRGLEGKAGGFGTVLLQGRVGKSQGQSPGQRDQLEGENEEEGEGEKKVENEV